METVKINLKTSNYKQVLIQIFNILLIVGLLVLELIGKAKMYLVAIAIFTLIVLITLAVITIRNVYYENKKIGKVMLCCSTHGGRGNIATTSTDTIYSDEKIYVEIVCTRYAYHKFKSLYKTDGATKKLVYKKFRKYIKGVS